MACSGKKVIVVGFDNNDPSLYALEWVLDNFFAPFGSNSPFKLIIVHAHPNPPSILGFAGRKAAEVIPLLQTDFRRRAQKVIDKANEICKSKKVKDAQVEIKEGDARNVMCDAVDRYRATILVVGSHNHGSVKRALLGSVSDYCTHNARCSVLIVKKPKNYATPPFASS